MTVKILDQIQKDTLVDMYRHYNVKPSHLAREFKVSSRTVYRVLNEQGICRPVTVLPKTDLFVFRLSEKFSNSTKHLLASEDPPKPKVMQRIRHVFRRLFTFQPTA